MPTIKTSKQVTTTLTRVFTQGDIVLAVRNYYNLNDNKTRYEFDFRGDCDYEGVELAVTTSTIEFIYGEETFS